MCSLLIPAEVADGALSASSVFASRSQRFSPFCPAALLRPAVRCCVCRGDRRAGAEPEPGDRCEAAVLWVCPDLAARHQPDELPENGEKGLKFAGVLRGERSSLLEAQGVCVRAGAGTALEHRVALFEGRTGSEKRGDLRAGLSPALERHETLRFSGFAVEKMEFNFFFFSSMNVSK